MLWIAVFRPPFLISFLSQKSSTLLRDVPDDMEAAADRRVADSMCSAQKVALTDLLGSKFLDGLDVFKALL